MAVLDVCARATPFTRTPRARRSRAAVEMLEPFTESGELLPPATKAMVTVPRPSIDSQPGNLESVGSSVSIAVGSDGVVFIRRYASRLAQVTQLIPMPGAVSVSHGADTCTPNVHRLFAGNINAPERITVSNMQRDSELQLIAAKLDNIIPFVRRKFEEDGLDADEFTTLNELVECSNRQLRQAEIFDLTQSLDRVGLNKRNARRLRELFPGLGPGIA